VVSVDTRALRLIVVTVDYNCPRSAVSGSRFKITLIIHVGVAISDGALITSVRTYLHVVLGSATYT
jgi:hypothetical protein